MSDADGFTWRDYEDHIYEKLKEWAGDQATVEFDQSLPGRFSKIDRQIDVLVRGRFANVTNRDMVAVVDCKYYTRKIDVKKVDEFLGFLDDTQADMGLLITNKGFSQSAKDRADIGRGVELQVIVADIDRLPPPYYPSWDEGYYESDYYEGNYGSPDMTVIRYSSIEPEALEYTFDPDNPPEHVDDVILSGESNEITWDDDEGRAACMRAILRHRNDGTELKSEDVKAAVLNLTQSWEDGDTWILYDGQLGEWGL
jgi:hypothetical protein